MRFCSYLITNDVGFAPNTFGDFCTLAACTPNHLGLRVEPGDWLMGDGQPERGSRLIYAMRISEGLDFDYYYRDPRFEGKKARRESWQTRCGDNIYFRDGTGRLVQTLNFYHNEPRFFEKDTRYPRVFISNHFYHFGENAPTIPDDYKSLIKTGVGCCCVGDPKTVHEFIEWLEQAYEPGLNGQPRDRDDGGRAVRIALIRKNQAFCNRTKRRAVVRRAEQGSDSPGNEKRRDHRVSTT